MSWRVRPTEPARAALRPSRLTRASRSPAPAGAGSGFRAFRDELLDGWRGGADLVVLRTVDSTNALARRALERDPFEPTGAPRVFVAWGQTAGRGRRGRRWTSAPGRGVYASVLLPLRSAAALELLPLLGPVVVCEGLRAVGAGGCGLKWPNDLVARGGKLGGLLIEAVSAAREPRAAIVGVGVNHQAPPGGDLGSPAIGLVDLLPSPPTLGALARRLLDTLLDRLAHLESESRTALSASYGALSVHRPGDRLTCRTAIETLEGEFAGFDDRGRLRLAVGSGERLISAAEIVEGR